MEILKDYVHTVIDIAILMRTEEGKLNWMSTIGRENMALFV